MLKLTRMFWLSGALALSLLAAPWTAHAQSADSLPGNLLSALQAPGANVESVALNLAQSNPAYATEVLQAAINILGSNNAASADALKAFADQANALLAAGGNSASNAATSAALAVAVANVVGDPQNAALVNGGFAQVVNAAIAATNTALQNNAVQLAILNNAPGTQQIIQAANNNPPPGQNTGPNFAAGLGSSPAHP